MRRPWLSKLNKHAEIRSVITGRTERERAARRLARLPGHMLGPPWRLPPFCRAPHHTHMPCQLAAWPKHRGHALPSLFTSLMKLNHHLNFSSDRTKQGARWAVQREETMLDGDSKSLLKSGITPNKVSLIYRLDMNWSFPLSALHLILCILVPARVKKSFPMVHCSDYLRWDLRLKMGTRWVLKTISKPHSITTESRVVDGEVRHASPGRSPGRVPPWVWQYNEEQARYQGQAVPQDHSTNCFHLPSHSTSYHPALWNYAGKKLFTDELKALQMLNVEEKKLTLKGDEDLPQSSSVHWSIVIFWCPNNKV